MLELWTVFLLQDKYICRNQSHYIEVAQVEQYTIDCDYLAHWKMYYYSIEIKQQFLGIILCFFMYLKWPWLLRFFAKML